MGTRRGQGRGQRALSGEAERRLELGRGGAKSGGRAEQPLELSGVEPGVGPGVGRGAGEEPWEEPGAGRPGPGLVPKSSWGRWEWAEQGDRSSAWQPECAAPAAGIRRGRPELPFRPRGFGS